MFGERESVIALYRHAVTRQNNLQELSSLESIARCSPLTSKVSFTDPSSRINPPHSALGFSLPLDDAITVVPRVTKKPKRPKRKQVS
jgi:hypothetical protein